jgi:hypothetical protein
MLESCIGNQNAYNQRLIFLCGLEQTTFLHNEEQWAIMFCNMKYMVSLKLVIYVLFNIGSQVAR